MLEWFTRARHTKHVLSLFYLGLYYARSIGGNTFNYDETFRRRSHHYFHLAAELGHPEAFYYSTRYLPSHECMKSAKMAVESGHVDACLLLSRCHYKLGQMEQSYALLQLGLFFFLNVFVVPHILACTKKKKNVRRGTQVYSVYVGTRTPLSRQCQFVVSQATNGARLQKGVHSLPRGGTFGFYDFRPRHLCITF